MSDIKQRLLDHWQSSCNCIDKKLAIQFHTIKCKQRYDLIADTISNIELLENALPLEPSEDMIDAAISSTNMRLNIPGSAMTQNREKMRIRYKAMLQQHRKSNVS